MRGIPLFVNLLVRQRERGGQGFEIVPFCFVLECIEVDQDETVAVLRRFLSNLLAFLTIPEVFFPAPSVYMFRT